MSRNGRVAVIVVGLVAVLILAFVLLGPQTQPANTTATPQAVEEAETGTPRS